MSALDAFLTPQLQELRAKGLYNTIDTIQGANGAQITIDGKQLINLSSNNYLGFATDNRLKKVSIDAIQKYGVGAGAVRTINGTQDIHDKLESVIAKFKGTEAAIVFQSGFNCNMGAISAVLNKEDAILSDELNHASIIDGARLSGAKVIRVKHQDMDDLRSKAKETKESGLYKKIMYISDGVFSMDGDVAKIPQIVQIAKEFDLITYIDDAHGSGVMGNGAGTVKHFGLSKDIDMQIGTLSKAIGAVGGYVAGSQKCIDWLKVRARPFLFSTAMTPATAAACIEAFNLMESEPQHMENLWQNSKYLKEGLKNLGFDIGKSQTPITPCIIGEENLTQKFSKRLMQEGVYAKSIVFPTVPLGTSRVRNMPTAVHTKEMLDKVILAYQKVGKELGVIK